MEADSRSEPRIPQPGELWAYRKRDDAPSDQVLINNVVRDKQKVWVEIEFANGVNVGQKQSVSGNRLSVLWRDVEAYDLLMANWQRIEAEPIDEVGEFVCDVVYEHLIPSEVAEVFTGARAKNGLEVKDIAALEQLMGCPIIDVKVRNAWFDLDADLILSPTGGLDVAAAVCQENPDPILEYLMAEETKIRHDCKHGREDDGRLRRTNAWSLLKQRHGDLISCWPTPSTSFGGATNACLRLILKKNTSVSASCHIGSDRFRTDHWSSLKYP